MTAFILENFGFEVLTKIAEAISKRTGIKHTYHGMHNDSLTYDFEDGSILNNSGGFGLHFEVINNGFSVKTISVYEDENPDANKFVDDVVSAIEEKVSVVEKGEDEYAL